MNELEFSIDIEAPVARVWQRMLAADSYRDWTSAFCEGSTFEGSWAQGSQMRFLSPDGGGMLAEVQDNRLHECIVLRLVAELRDGAVLPDSPLATHPALEAYHFSATPAGGTRLRVQLQGWDRHLDFLQASWPVALQRLKALAEAAVPAPTVHKEIYVNLPCRHLPASKAFFEALGYAFDPRFSSEQGAALVLGGNLYAMLLAEDFARGFTAKPLVDARTATEVLVCLSCDSREQVDRLVAAAVAAGGSAPRPPVDHGVMYIHGFEDLDGHIWELMHMPEPPPAPSGAA